MQILLWDSDSPEQGINRHRNLMYRSKSLLSPFLGKYLEWTVQIFQISSSVGMEMMKVPFPCTSAGVFREQKNREEVAFSIKDFIKRNRNKVFVLPSYR